MDGARTDKTRFLRFLGAGALNSVFGFCVYAGAAALGAETWLALLAGILAGILFNFITTGGLVFRDLSPRRFPRFVLCYVIVYGLNLVLIQALAPWIADRILAQAILTAPLALLSYVLMSRFVFTGARHAS